MNNTSVFSRLSTWLKPAVHRELPQPALPLENEQATLRETAYTDRPGPTPVTTFLKPWAKRDAALQQLQEGFDTLTGLVTSVKHHLDRQAQRQDELLNVLQHLPAALRAIPENSRMQTETLKVVGEQLKNHNQHYHKLGEVLEKVADSSTDQRKLLDALHGQVETIATHDRSMADHLRSVSTSLENVTHNTHSSTQVLDHLKGQMRTRDTDLQLLLHRQGTRLTILLSAAVLFSLTALAGVALIGWKLLR